ncbi:MAG: TetR/AcrR family transcriptional regulator [Phototrophicaceae bacterium]|jgi:AcrR family transcriptional regulator
MPINQNDPRVRKTRRGLRDAFVRLILQHGYDDISIQQITDEAETARVTFYRHYHDKEELLIDCLNTLYDDLAAQIPPFSPEAIRNGFNPVRVLYTHIEGHETLYRILFSSRGTQIVIERMRHYLALQLMASLAIFLQGQALPMPLDILANHIASAQLGLAIWWLDQNKPYPADYMASISVWLSLAGGVRAVGQEGFYLPIPPMPPQ